MNQTSRATYLEKGVDTHTFELVAAVLGPQVLKDLL